MMPLALQSQLRELRWAHLGAGADQEQPSVRTVDAPHTELRCRSSAPAAELLRPAGSRAGRASARADSRDAKAAAREPLARIEAGGSDVAGDPDSGNEGGTQT